MTSDCTSDASSTETRDGGDVATEMTSEVTLLMSQVSKPKIL